MTLQIELLPVQKSRARVRQNQVINGRAWSLEEHRSSVLCKQGNLRVMLESGPLNLLRVYGAAPEPVVGFLCLFNRKADVGGSCEAAGVSSSRIAWPRPPSRRRLPPRPNLPPRKRCSPKVLPSCAVSATRHTSCHCGLQWVKGSLPT